MKKIKDITKQSEFDVIDKTLIGLLLLIILLFLLISFKIIVIFLILNKYHKFSGKIIILNETINVRRINLLNFSFYWNNY